MRGALFPAREQFGTRVVRSEVSDQVSDPTDCNYQPRPSSFAIRCCVGPDLDGYPVILFVPVRAAVNVGEAETMLGGFHRVLWPAGGFAVADEDARDETGSDIKASKVSQPRSGQLTSKLQPRRSWKTFCRTPKTP